MFLFFIFQIDAQIPSNQIRVLHEGKQFLPLNLKHSKGREIFRKLCSRADVLIDPYRPGVLEKLDLGPDTLLADNPRLIYARLSGFGQSGPLKDRAGHDINYVALSGVLSMLGQSNEKPVPPVNFMADFAGGGLLCGFGILAALLERHNSGRGQIVDNSMAEGAAYVASWLFRSRQRLPIWGNERGQNILDGGAFYYRTYETKDGKFMSVGALEPQFYQQFIEALELSHLNQFGDNEEAAKIIENKFQQKTQAEWTKIFQFVDACVFPVLDWQQVAKHPQNVQRKAFILDRTKTDGDVAPAPAPRLSRTPPVSGILKRTDGFLSKYEILNEIGLSQNEIEDLEAKGIEIKAKL